MTRAFTLHDVVHDALWALAYIAIVVGAYLLAYAAWVAFAIYCNRE